MKTGQFRSETGSVSLILIVLSIIVVLGGVLLLLNMTRTPSKDILSSPSSSSKAINKTVSSTSSAEASQDIDAQIESLDKESLDLDKSLNDAPIDVMQD